MTPAELELIEKLQEALEAFNRLVPYHADEITAFEAAIISLQNQIAARPARRLHYDCFDYRTPHLSKL